MSEMQWEDAPEVYVPKVRDWVGPAFDSWLRLFYGRRQLTVLWGIFIPIWAVWQLVKMLLFATGILVLIASYLLSVPVELATYRRRYRRAVLSQWGPYMREIHD